METKVNFNVMECVETVVKYAEDSHLRESFFESNAVEIAFLSDYLKTGKTEAVLFACALAFWFDSNTFSDIFRFLGMKEFHILKYRSEIENLYQKNLLKCTDRTGKQINKYEVTQTVLYAVSKNISLKIKEHISEKTKTEFIDVLEEFDNKSNDFDRENIEFFEFVSYIDELYERFPDMPFFRKVQTFRLSAFELYFLMDTIWDALDSGDNNFNTTVSCTVEDFYKRKGTALKNLNMILEHESKLTRLHLIELSRETFRNRTKAKISKSFLKFLKENENIQLEDFEKENQKLIQSQKIQKKTLYYNHSEIASLQTLKSALTEEKFSELQKRLYDKAMPLGISVLLHGEPGTGKTESVFQLARESRRNIFKVDISETKSMWFGESQKLVKKIFEDYRNFREEEKRCPILLFNEADAVIGKRKPAGSSGVADTENAIQNILLEELEKFDGILFATTNLVENLDAAFERRFLYKIRFEKPALEIAVKIWKSKLPFLKISEAEKLVSQFQFSGGEMENIARKMLMNEILNGEKPSFQKVLEFCRGEKWEVNGNVSKIGF